MEAQPCVRALASRLQVTMQEGRFDWPQIEQNLGLCLPDDYKQLVGFPTGVFKGVIQLIRPGDYNESPLDYLGFFAHGLNDLRKWRKGGHGSFPHPLYPERGGLLPWARGARMELLFWLTEGPDPNSWPVVYVDYDCTDWRRFDGTACAFLTEFVEGRIDATPFYFDIQDAPAFKPLDF